MDEISEDSELESERQEIEKVMSWISTSLREKGFIVKKKEVIEGERVRHMIDILAEINPLPDVSLKIGFIIRNRNIDVDDVERYIAWLDELPLDKLVLVTTKDVSIEAYELAKKFNIDIIKFDLGKLMRLGALALKELYDELYVEPLISFDKAINIVKRESKSLLARKRKLETCALTYIPLINIDGEIAEKHIEEEKVTIRSISIAFDGIEGYKIATRGETLVLEEDLGSLVDIPSEALIALKKLSEYGAMEISELAGALGISKDRLKMLINILVTKSLVDIYGDLVETRYTLFTHPVNIKELIRKYNVRIHTSIPTIEGKGAVVVPIRVNINKLLELIESVNGKIKSLSVIYYPFYIGILTTEEGGIEELLVVDGLSGNTSTNIAVVLSNIEILDKIRAKSCTGT